MLDYLASLSEKELWESLNKLCENPEETQKKVLQDILKKAQNSEFAKKHNLSDKDTPESFVKKVSLHDWKDYEEYSERMQNGEKNLLFNGAPEVFVETSGTTGEQKLIFESSNGLKAKTITEKIKKHILFSKYPEALDGYLFPLVNKKIVGYTKAGIPFGMASGITLSKASEDLKKKIAFPLEVLEIENQEALEYCLMRFAIEKDITFIAGNNLAKMEKLNEVAKENAEQICKDIEKGEIWESLPIEKNIRKKLEENLSPNPKRAEELRKILKEKEFILLNYWKNIKVIWCWTSSSVGMVTQRTKRLFPKDTVYFDYGYGASEGKFNIPYKKDNPSGIITLYSAFYEFIPFEEENAKPLPLHKLEKDKLYHLIITNYSGLYRYRMHDIIKVTGFFKNTPEIVFYSKAGEVANLAWERIPASFITDIVQKSAKSFSIKINHFCLSLIYNPSRYVFCVELSEETPQTTLKKFVESIDTELKTHIGYNLFRHDKVFDPPELKIMKKGWYEELLKEKEEKGTPREQIKLPVIYNKVIPKKEMIIETISI